MTILNPRPTANELLDKVLIIKENCSTSTIFEGQNETQPRTAIRNSSERGKSFVMGSL
jgi:hypothetical protein